MHNLSESEFNEIKRDSRLMHSIRKLMNYKIKNVLF